MSRSGSAIARVEQHREALVEPAQVAQVVAEHVDGPQHRAPVAGLRGDRRAPPRTTCPGLVVAAGEQQRVAERGEHPDPLGRRWRGRHQLDRAAERRQTLLPTAGRQQVAAQPLVQRRRRVPGSASTSDRSMARRCMSSTARVLLPVR